MLALGFGFVEIGTVHAEPQPGNAQAAPLPLELRTAPSSTGSASTAQAWPPLYGTSPPGAAGAASSAPISARTRRAATRRPTIAAAWQRWRRTRTISRSMSPRPTRRACARCRGASPSMRSSPRCNRRAPRQALRGRRSSSRSPLILAPEDCRDIAQVALSRGLDGLIVGNTTLSRPATLKSRHRGEAGGLSGPPLMALSTRILAEMYRLSAGRIPIVGVGGVASGPTPMPRSARAPRSCSFTRPSSMPGQVSSRRIKSELAGLLRRDGFHAVAEAVGADHR